MSGLGVTIVYCALRCTQKQVSTLKTFLAKRLDRNARFTTKIINEELSGNNRRPYCSRGRGSSFFLYLLLISIVGALNC